MKKIFSMVMLAVVLCLGLVGCNGQNGGINGTYFFDENSNGMLDKLDEQYFVVNGEDIALYDDGATSPENYKLNNTDEKNVYTITTSYGETGYVKFENDKMLASKDASFNGEVVEHIKEK